MSRSNSIGDLTEGWLLPIERYWRDHYELLKARGYVLRPRLRPGWQPSWPKGSFNWDKAEDGQVCSDGRIIDATRVSDGAYVVMKRFVPNPHAYEYDEAVAKTFSAEPLASDPRNHCVPVDDWMTLADSDVTWRVMVMPLLREYGTPRFDTIGEVVSMWLQIFEGLHFMHINHVAHRDCTNNNIMMDASPMYPEPFHPVKYNMRRDWKARATHYTRTQRPPKYYLIDFGLSCIYRPDAENPLIGPARGGDKTLPEIRDHPNEPYNPFPADVYYIGNWVRVWFMQKFYRFDFMRSLVDDMVQRDPAKRPTMAEVIERFDIIVKSLSSWKLRSRVVKRKENILVGVYRYVGHWKRRVGYVVTACPAIPVPCIRSPDTGAALKAGED